jgi:glycosyltransferase involved in cell wall biosynthesis
MATIFAKKTVGRLETLQYANKKFNWSNRVVIGVSAYFGFWAWIIARLTGRKFIYYAIDFYSPEIAEDTWDLIFIRCAMLMDRFLVWAADECWDISERINEGRAKFGHYRVKESRIIPLAYPPHYFRYSGPRMENKGIVAVYVGLDPYGLELFEGLDEVELKWIGKGKLSLDELLTQVSQGTFGVSLWKEQGNNYYGDPGKTKLYSACGLPVIMTDNTPYAKIIKDTMAGIVIKYNKGELRKAIKEIAFNYGFYKRRVKDTWKYINADDVFRDIKLLGN